MRRSESTKISRLHDRSYNEYPVFSAASVKKWEKFGLKQPSAKRTVDQRGTVSSCAAALDAQQAVEKWLQS
jgi:hypothetical protein